MPEKHETMWDGVRGFLEILIVPFVFFTKFYKEKRKQKKLKKDVEFLIQNKVQTDISRHQDIDYLIQTVRRQEFLFKAILGEENYELAKNYK